MRLPGQIARPILLLHLMQPRRIFLTQIQNQQHRLLRQKLKPANPLLVRSIELQIAQRRVSSAPPYFRTSSSPPFIRFRIARLLPVPIHPIQPLLHHHQIAQDQLHLHIAEIARRIHRPMLMRQISS